MALLLRLAYRFLGLALLPGLLAGTPLLAAPDAKEQGWSIYQRARAAAGVSAGGRPVRDYRVELVTRVKDAEGQEVNFTAKNTICTPTFFDRRFKPHKRQ